MPWPISQDYNEAVQDPASCFSDAQLRTGEPRLTPLGLPLPRSGNFADVYEVTCPDGSRWAVKCFTRQVPSLAQRYAAISRHLQAVTLPFMVDFHFLEQGIRIRGQWYPVLKMRWVEGQLLNEIVRDNLDKPAILQQLLTIWSRMGRRLHEAGVAHADLQHGNVIFVPGSTTRSLAVKLIDYDGMYVPALASSKSGEVGHPSYQHPQRLREGTWSADVDRTPLLVVATAMRALAVGERALWQKYDNGDNLLFRESDLRTPGQSPLFAELEGMTDPLLRTLVGALKQGCAGPPEQVVQLDELVPEEKPGIRTAAAQAVVVPGWQWDFGDEPEAAPARRRRKRGAPTWAWAAAIGVSMLAAVVGGVMAFRGDGRSPNTKGPVASGGSPTTARVTPQTVPTAPTTKRVVNPPDPGAEEPLPPVVPVSERLRPYPAKPDHRAAIPADADVAIADKKLDEMVAGKDARETYYVIHHTGVGPGNDFVLRYAALLRELEAGSKEGNPIRVIQTIDAMHMRYAIDTLPTQCDAVERAAKNFQRRFGGFVVGNILRFKDQARAQERFDLALRFARAAREIASRDNQPEVIANVDKDIAELERIEKERASAQGDIKALADNPSDPRANLAVGRLRCFILGAWEEGLPLLAKGDDPPLAELAKKDLATDEQAAACKETADAWLARADMAQGTEESAARQRAHTWYTRAQALTPDADVKDKLAALEAQHPELKGPWGHLSLGMASVKDDVVQLDGFRRIATRAYYRGGIDIRVEARADKNNVRIEAGAGGLIIFNWEGKEGDLRVHAPGGTDLGPFVGETLAPLTPKTWYRLRWRLTPTNIEIWKDDEKVFQKPGRYDLSKPRPVTVHGHGHDKIEVRSVMVWPVRGN